MNSWKKVFVCDQLTPILFAKAKSLSCDAILYYNSDVDVEEEKDIICVSVRQYDRLSFERKFRRNKKLLEKIAMKYPEFYSFKSISLVEGINKDLFWSTMISGMFEYVLENEISKETTVIDVRASKKYWKRKLKKIRLVLLVIKDKLFGKEKVIQLNTTFESAPFKHLFCLNGDAQAAYYQPVMKELGEGHCLTMKHPISGYKQLDKTPKHLVGFKPVQWSLFKGPLFMVFKLLREFTVDEVTLIIQKRNELILSLKQIDKVLYEYPHLKSVFLCAQESSGFGNVLSLYMKDKKEVVVNSHNGVKHRDVYNEDNHFDIWCTWDQQMEEVLMACGIDKSCLKITGNLSEDKVRAHSYSGFFDDFLSKGDFVLSFFSTIFNGTGKRDIANWIFNKLDEIENLKVIIRLHPFEHDEEFWNAYPIHENKKVFFIDPKKIHQPTLLYDQLSISNISIVLGSTVALESKWFGVPCITFEKTENSLLYCVDDELVFHANTIDQLNEIILRQYQNRATKHKVVLQEGQSVAVAIANEVRQFNKKIS